MQAQWTKPNHCYFKAQHSSGKAFKSQLCSVDNNAELRITILKLWITHIITTTMAYVESKSQYLQINIMLHKSHSGISWPTLFIVVSHNVLIIWIWVLCKVPLNKISSIIRWESTTNKNRNPNVMVQSMAWSNQKSCLYSDETYLKKMWMRSMYLQYRRIGWAASVATSWKLKKSFGIWGGPAISLALCKPRTNKSITKP